MHRADEIFKAWEPKKCLLSSRAKKPSVASSSNLLSLSLSLFLKAELLQDQQEKTCFFELEGGGEREGDRVVVARENDRDSALEPERGTPTLVSFWEVVERVDSCWSISLLSFLLKLA